MGKINILSFAVANLIAAGEVVDRPASVIKELMENSIDSGADRITVEIQNGGVAFMRVSDNGCGIEKDDLAVAVRRHATSKIKDSSDLDGIMTLGFRGEALAAVAAVSDMRIISRERGGVSGASIEVSGGDILGVSERGCSEGTTVLVENLFFNVPARRKFLKKDVTETAAVSAAVEKIALSHPEIAIRFISDGEEKLSTAGDGKLLNTIYALYGREFAKGLLEIIFEYEGISVKGYAGRSDNVKPNRSGQSFFINGRYVRSKTASAAVEQAYISYMPQEKFPVCILFIGISPRSVDVNVHPAKLEVKFSNEKPVFEAIYYGIKNALESNSARPDIDPSKLSRISYEEYKKLFTSGQPAASTVRNAVQPLKNPDSRIIIKQEPEVKTTFPPVTSKASEKQMPDKLTTESYIEEFKKPGNELPIDGVSDGENLPSENIQETLPPITEPPQLTDENLLPDKTGSQEENIVPAGTNLPQYRIIGEVFNTYIIVDFGQKMLLVDKHAAHERIIFEKFKAGMKSAEVRSQVLMLPVEFMLKSDEVLILSQYRDEIEKIGFHFETEKYTVKVNTVPDIIELSAVEDIFMTIADRLMNEAGSAGLTRDIIFEKALYQASCKAAIKAGREYGPDHIRWLIGKLIEIPDITVCPHGRPVAMEISKAALDRQFKRT